MASKSAKGADMLLQMHRHGLVSLKATWFLDGVAIGQSRTNRSLLYGSADATVQGTSWRFQQQDRRAWVVLDAAGRTSVTAVSLGRATIQFRVEAAGRQIDMCQPTWRGRLQIGEPNRGASRVEMSRYGRTLCVVLPNDLEPVSAIFMLWLAAVTLDGVSARAGMAISF